MMRDFGVAAWGQSLTGVGLYGLVQGAVPSQDLRTQLRHHLGPMGGIVMAAIADNEGATRSMKEGRLEDKVLKPLRVKTKRDREKERQFEEE